MTYLSDDSEESYRSLQRFFRNNSEASSAIDCRLFPVIIIDGWDVVGAVDGDWLFVVVLTGAVVIGIIESSFSCNAAFGWRVFDVGIIYFHRVNFFTSMCALIKIPEIFLPLSPLYTRVCVCVCYVSMFCYKNHFIEIKIIDILMFYCCYLINY